MRVFVINLVHAGAIALLSPLLPWGVLPAQSSPAIAQADPAAQLAEGDRLLNLGVNQFNNSRFQEAIQSWQQALKIYQSSNIRSTFRQESRRREGVTLSNLGEAYRHLGQYRQALELYEQSLLASREIGDIEGEGNTLNNLGIVYDLLGQHEQAISVYEQQLAIVSEVNNRRGEGSVLINLGISYANLGRYEQANILFEKGLVIFREIGDHRREGATLLSLGTTYGLLGNYREAIFSVEQSLNIARQNNDLVREGVALDALGSIYQALGQNRKAITFHEEHLAISLTIGSRRNQGNALGNLGNAYLGLKQYEEAINYYTQSLVIHREIGNLSGEAAGLNNLGEVYRILGRHQEAVDHYEKSLVIVRDIGDLASEGATLGNLGIVYADLGQFQRAINFYGQQISIGLEIGDQLRVATAFNNSGSAYWALGQSSNAIESFLKAIESYESLRTNNLTDADKVSLFDTYLHSYLSLQRSFIAQNEIEQALVFSERGRSRALADLLAIRVSGNSDSDAPLLDSVEALSLAGIQRVAREQQATLVQYSVVSSGSLFIWVIQPTGEIAFQAVDLAGQDLPELVSLVRETLGVRGSDRGDIFIAHNAEASEQQQAERQQQLQQLHQLLIDPIASHLPTDPTQRVVIIPHQDLFLVPFAALVNADGQYLIENHTLLTAPSIQVLDLTHQQRLATGPSTLQGSEMLIVGNPTMPSVWNPLSNQVTQLSPLKGAENEAIAIANDFGTEALLGDRATKAAVVQHMPQARIIHFATHGLLEYGTPEDSGVLDVPGAIALAPNGDDAGLLTSAEILQLNLTADLVVLSACDTGRGRITGDGVIGLSRAFTTAGVPSLMVSLWAVDDESTAALMQAFYFHWQQTGDKAQALRQAMLTTLQDYPDPRLWAAFTLIGAAE